MSHYEYIRISFNLFILCCCEKQVFGFLMQQTGGYFMDEIRLVDARNRMGETPLLRTMNTGVQSVIKVSIQNTEKKNNK